MKRQLSNGPQIKKRASTSSSSQAKNPTSPLNSSSSSQSTSPVIKKLKEDLRLAKSAIRTCPICSKGILIYMIRCDMIEKEISEGNGNNTYKFSLQIIQISIATSKPLTG